MMNRIILSAAASSLAIIAMAGAAMASGPAAVTSIESGTIETDFGDADYSGLRFELDNELSSGLNYHIDLREGDTEGLAARRVTTQLGYTLSGIGGPVVGYEYASLGGLSNDRVMLGAAGSYDLTPDLDISGKVLSDVDNFGNDIDLTLGVGYAISHATRVSAEYERFDAKNEVLELGTLGIQHDLSDRVYVDGKAIYGDTTGATLRGASVGVGFRF